MKIFWRGAVGPLQCNCYIVGDALTKEVVVIDPGGDSEDLTEVLAREELTVTAIVATHAHFDHILAAASLRELTGAPFYLHPDDNVLLDWYEMSGRLFLGIDLGAPPEVDTSLAEGDVLKAGASRLEVLHTPGHSPGSISLVADDAVFSGDSLFAAGVGRTDLPGGDSQQLIYSIRAKLFRLPEELLVYPGHGPSTTLVEEQRSNPFVGADAGLWFPNSG